MFTENLNAFVDTKGHGQTVVAGSQTCNGILNAPGQEVQGIITTEYTLEYITSALTLSHGMALTVDGVAFTVRRFIPIDDGAFSIATLSRTT